MYEPRLTREGNPRAKFDYEPDASRLPYTIGWYVGGAKNFQSLNW